MAILTRTAMTTLTLGLGILATAQAFAAGQPPRYYRSGSPVCESSTLNGASPQSLPIDDGAVLQLKETAPEGQAIRAHVEGTIVDVEQDESNHGVGAHNKFIISIGPNPGDVLEVVYNEDFGALPQLENGMTVEACGDFINSRTQDGPYPPSPAGAIIHWVHENPSSHGHPSGFLVIQSQLYGDHPTSGANGNSP